MSFADVIEFAVSQRPALRYSIGYHPQVAGAVVPQQISFMYTQVSGTKEAIEDQSLMDLIPGLRLIHKEEMQAEIVRFHKAYEQLESFLPFMADYSSCYVSMDSKDGAIYRVAPEYGTSKLSQNIENFWRTVLTCYQEGAFFLDDEGYLDFDYDLEGEIGESINPSCEYWME